MSLQSRFLKELRNFRQSNKICERTKSKVPETLDNTDESEKYDSVFLFYDGTQERREFQFKIKTNLSKAPMECVALKTQAAPIFGHQCLPSQGQTDTPGYIQYIYQDIYIYNLEGFMIKN